MKALILGSSGQDGSYLAGHLAEQGVEVFGMIRRPRPPVPGVRHVDGDLLDSDSLHRVLREVRPDEVYNLAAVTSPGGAWGTPQPPLLAEVTGTAVAHLLEAVRTVVPDARVVHASSSAIYDPHRYGLYGIAKLFAHHAVIGYRTSLAVSNAVFYSHTSPRQDGRFLAPTVCRTLARFHETREKLTLTDLDGRRDWGYAPDLVRALPLIARAQPGDYVVATGQTHSVRELVAAALDAAGLTWAEAAPVTAGPRTPAPLPADLTALTGLGWKPGTSFTDMIREMVASCAR